jgi:PAS domain-containing protein
MITKPVNETLFYFLEQAPAYVYLMDKDLRYVYLNAASRNSPAYGGRSLEELRGHKGEEFALHQDVPELASHDREILENGGHQIYEEQIVGLTLLSIKWAVHDDNGDIYGVGGISIDVTDLALLERRKMEYMVRAVSNSHDIVEAITTGVAELALQSAKQNGKGHSLI